MRDKIATFEEMTLITNSLYNKIISKTRRLLSTPADDLVLKHRVPLVDIYMNIAQSRCSMHKIKPFFYPEDGMYYKSQPNIPFCVKNGLSNCKDIPICRFNFEELMTSLIKLEQNLHKVHYTESLLDYIDALEYRVCEILTTSQDKNVHNIETCRRMLDYDEAVCTLSAECMLVISIVALRKYMVGTIGWLRTNGALFVDAEEDFSDEQRGYFDMIKKSLIREYNNMHDETVKNDFTVRYTKACVFRSEKFKYYKEFQLQRRIEYGQIVKKYRNGAEWEKISAASKQELDIHLANRMNDTMAFRISFWLMMEHLMKSKCGVPFSDFSILSQNIIRLSDESLKRIMEISDEVPIYIISLNDACVLWQKTLHVFGCESDCYIQALYFWLSTIQNLCGGYILGKYHIRSLIKCFIDLEPVSSSTPVSTSELAAPRMSLYDILCGPLKDGPIDPHRKMIDELRQPGGGGLRSYLTDRNREGDGFDMDPECAWVGLGPRK